MEKLEKWFLRLAVGAVPPLIGFLAAWWGTFHFFNNWQVFLAALAGVGAGLIVDGFFLKKWMEKAWNSRLLIWVALLVFYSICAFGFFMGVPVFNLFLAIPAGFYMGRRLAHSENAAGEKQHTLRQTQIATTVILAGICTSSAVIAWRDPTTAANLEGMLMLKFEVTQSMIAGLILIGGTGLLLANWWLSGKTIELSTKLKWPFQGSGSAKITSA